MRYRLRTLLIATAVVGAILGLVMETARSIRPTNYHWLSAEFTEMPSRDVSLEEWLGRQPGVTSVHVDRETNGIRITWSMSRDLMGQPPLPDVRGNFDRLGYKGLKAYDEH